MQEQLSTSWENMTSMLIGWMDAAIMNLPNILLALFVFIISFWLARKIRGLLRKPLERAISEPSVRSLVGTTVSIAVVGVGLFLALGIMNLDTVLKSMLAGAGVAGLAIGLALQGTLSNTFSGIVLAIKKVMNVGDFVESNGYTGTVESINLRNTIIRETDNNFVVLPNKLVLENPFKNYGLTRQVRTTVKCGVSYDSNLEFVRQVAVNAIAERFPPEDGKEIEFHYLEFGGSSINFQLRFWANATINKTKLEVTSEAIMLLKAAFDDNGIQIPFPIRTLQLEKSSPLQVAVSQRRSGIKQSNGEPAYADTQ